FVAENGLPGDSWPQANSLKKLKTELEKIRRQEWIAHQPGKDLVGVACPIRENGQARAKNGGGDSVVAALGIFLPAFRFKGAHKKAIIKEMTAAAAGISARLASQSSAIQA
ncbi:MAG: IclR family transcriptional regulator C-terminal domain-containing protein, partial [Kiritimatiellae bacterium]|nr:IclR family transcriptional regulator C-terminal domain-containing protein [Kiritimatiellia bacterium]